MQTTGWEVGERLTLARMAVLASSLLTTFVISGGLSGAALAQEQPCAGEVSTAADWKATTPCIEAKIREKLQRPRDPTLYSNGQGFFVGDGRFAMTAAHIVAGCQYFSVIDLNGAEASAGLVFWDSRRDIAVLRVDAGKAITRVGGTLASLPRNKAVGNVLIPTIDLLATFRTGSAEERHTVTRNASGPNDAPVGPEGVMVLEGQALVEGASGSPVFNPQGDIVGMVSANIPLRGNDGPAASRTVAVSSNELNAALRYASEPSGGQPLSRLPAPNDNIYASLVRIRCR